LSRAASAASKLRLASLPLLGPGAGPAADGGMVEGWVGTGVGAGGVGGGSVVGVDMAGDTSNELPRSVMLMVGNGELR